MTNEQFEQVIILVKFIGTVGMGLWAAIIAFTKYLSHEEAKLKERTVEPTKIREFLDELEKLGDRVDNLERDSGHNMIEVRTLKADLKGLIDRLLDNISTRKNKI